MAGSDSSYRLNFVHGLPVVGKVSQRSKRWVEENPDLIAVALTGLIAYGTYRGVKWLYRCWKPAPAIMSDFAEEGLDYDYGDDYAGLPLAEEAPRETERRKTRRVPLVQDPEPRAASPQDETVLSQQETYGDDFGSEVVGDEYAGEDYDI